MWVTIRRPDGSIKEIELSFNPYIEIGDILWDGSVVIELTCPDKNDEDFYAMEGYGNECEYE